jgi:hypothetical protein
VKVPLDTPIWIWWLLGCERLSIAHRRALDRLAEGGGCHLSAMSLLEAQMLHSKGRLSLDRHFSPWLQQASAPGVVALLPMDVRLAGVALAGWPSVFPPLPGVLATISRSCRSCRAVCGAPSWAAGTGSPEVT